MVRSIITLVGGIVYLALAIMILVGVWLYDSGILNKMMDINLSLIKELGASLPATYGDKTESALRFIAGEKSLILIEISMALRIATGVLKKIIIEIFQLFFGRKTEVKKRMAKTS